MPQKPTSGAGISNLWRKYQTVQAENISSKWGLYVFSKWDTELTFTTNYPNKRNLLFGLLSPESRRKGCGSKSPSLKWAWWCSDPKVIVMTSGHCGQKGTHPVTQHAQTETIKVFSSHLCTMLPRQISSTPAGNPRMWGIGFHSESLEIKGSGMASWDVF